MRGPLDRHPKRAAPGALCALDWTSLPTDTLRAVLFAIGTGDPGAIVHAGGAPSGRGLRSVDRSRRADPLSRCLVGSIGNLDSDDASVGPRVLVHRWRSDFALTCRRFAHAAATLCPGTVRRWAGRAMCEQIMYVMRGPDLAPEAPLPHVGMIADTLDTALEATSSLRGADVRRAVRDGATRAHGALMLRYALGCPLAPIAPTLDLRACSAAERLALFGIVLVYSPDDLCRAGADLMRLTATGIAPLYGVSEDAAMAGLMRAYVRRNRFRSDALYELAPPLPDDDEAPIDPHTQWPAMDGRVALPLSVAREVMAFVAAGFFSLPRANQNDPAIWLDAAREYPRVLRECVDKGVLARAAGTRSRPGRYRRFLRTLLLREFARAGKLPVGRQWPLLHSEEFVCDMLADAPKCSRARGHLVMQLPCAMRRSARVHACAFQHGGDAGGCVDNDTLVLYRVVQV